MTGGKVLENLAHLTEMEAWRICAGWLVQCGALPPTHKSTWANAQVFDLAQTLRDGVVLCQLLNHLSPGAVDLTRDICLRPQMSQFLCLKNIRTFLQACSRVFCLRSQELFDPDGLFDVTDFGQVIYTLSKLSQSPLAAARGVQAFVVDYEDEQAYDEDIYKNLEDLADEHDLANEGDIYDTVEGEEDSIYDDLVSLRKQKSQFQQSQHSYSHSHISEPEPKKDKRQYCIEEIVETEKKYVDALYMLINGFKKPLSHNIPPKTIKDIFLNMDELHSGHCLFNSDLGSSQNSSRPHRNRPSMTISDVFLKHREIFLLYGFYCSNLVPAQDTVDDILKDPTARQKIEECEFRANKNKFRLRDLLSVPMQRCMKYHLLLRELIKHTDKSHPEKAELEKALDIMQDVCLYVNEVKRDNEIMQNNKDIEKSMVNYRGPNVNEHGRLQNDGELKLKMTGNTKKSVTSSTQKYCFLFDKVLIVCNKGGKLGMEKFWGQESHEYCTTIDLEKYKIEDNLPKGKSGKWNWCFWLTPVNNNNNDDVFPVEIYCKTEDMMLKWVESIRLAQDNINPVPSSQHKYEYTSFREPTYCKVCEKLLRGLFYQGYKCTACSINAHKECLNSEKIQHCTAARRISRQPQGVQVVRAVKVYPGTPRPPPGVKPLLFERNDLIEVLDKDDPKWWKGRSTRTYEQGLFPADYVVPQRQSTSSHPRPNYEMTVPQGSPSHIRQNPSSSSRNLLDTRWYVGKMDRHVAIEQLKDKQDSCYLVRDSVKESEFQTHAISIKHDNQVKHIKVLYYLGKYGLVDKDSCDFDTLPDLIMHYSQNSLRDVFNGLDSTLKIPLRERTGHANSVSQRNGPSTNDSPVSRQRPSPAPEQKVKRYTVIGTARALFPFTARESGELPLQKGDHVDIISKAGESRGWWKGAVGGRIGYFPLQYVEEEE
ncbi:guanine nucleotide exchange factor VAV2-like isoform X2 [Acanthaster planci]|uniref:Guanine nucleotide exchange factor VAV2-like isoform X2 n=1 Tax=Acanthaster planci TaxID=133434 RepID=A0A8B7Z2D9_ACAPL|nr:guanine nucleotide exchange factor VAV2-like isoform X2 [Acanthaster planci]